MDAVRTSEEWCSDLLAGAQYALAEQTPDVADLLSHYYRHALPEDLVERQPHDLLGAALSHRQTAERRHPGEPIVRVLTPSAEADGWSTGFTVIQLVVDDTPFIVDSVTAEMTRLGHEIRMLLHPQLRVRRDLAGRLTEVGSSDEDALLESWVHIEVPRLADAQEAADLVENLRRILADVKIAVADWHAMSERARGLVVALPELPAPSVKNDALQASQLLDWMAADNFLFLGYRRYRLDESAEGPVLESVDGSGLGLLRKEPASNRRLLTGLPAEKAAEQRLLVLTKANSRSTVHRPSYLDYIGIKTFDADGRVTGEHLFLGLFTSHAYSSSVTAIGFLTRKIDQIIARSGFARDSHSGKDLMSVLETYPRDELFQADEEYVTAVATKVVASRHHQQTNFFCRKDEYGRFVSCLVFLPRDRYNTQVRRRIERLLLDALGGASAEYTAAVTDSPLAMIHFVIRMKPGAELPEIDAGELEAWVRAATRTWESDWLLALDAEFGETLAAPLARRWRGAFDPTYQASYHPRTAAADIRHLEELPDSGMSASLYESQGSAPSERRLKLYCATPVGLTDVMPVLLDFGLTVTDERPYQVTASGKDSYYILDFGVRAPGEGYWAGDSAERRLLFLNAFTAVWSGRAESDPFNQLVGTIGLLWQQVACLRAIAGYLAQTTHYSRPYLESALTENPGIAALLVRLFECRFDPDRTWPSEEKRAETAKHLTESILGELNNVPSLDHDRIVRCFVSVICATLRTNYFNSPIFDDQTSIVTTIPCIAFKLDPQAIPHLPTPRPRYEIWVYSPAVEGVHLRFGKVARGGLRWSDRREDFRTEVLGLVKAQIVKNAVIVPTGAKGGFFPRNLPDPQRHRNEWMAQGRLAYYSFVEAMLSITDNLVDGAVMHPDRTVRYDGDDTYLVVAADKGTAALSDLANEIARTHEFWLDDAFASGGSVGYDHKKMGITARGAWESVKRHFRELGTDTQSDDIRVVGIGDMSGDVFGNGMLRSRHICLVAAFDHRHIFIDPDPNPEASFDERRRLFTLPSSSWANYSRELISSGGGVFPRSAKSIAVSPQMRLLLPALGDAKRVTPTEMIRAIRQAPVDLLWNGGIGTYVKATDELHSEVGDHSNDAIRINGAQLACQVVGEGGNLGFSQRGRVEAALRGVRINTDAVDNSAGVELSDHEVNIKILLDRLVWTGQMTVRQRNDLLTDVAEEVAAQVLRTNYVQNVLLGNARHLGGGMLLAHDRLMKWLEDDDALDRELEALPDHDTLVQRSKDGDGLMTPEFAVIMAHTKRALKDRLLASDLPDDPWLEREVRQYFPSRFGDFSDALAQHPLRREIVATRVANSLVDRGGITFAQRAMEETGAGLADIARAFIVCREVFDMDSFMAAVEALDATVPTALQSELYLEFRRLLDQGVRTLLDRPKELRSLERAISRYRPVAEQIAQHLRGLLAEDAVHRLEERAADLRRAGIPENLAIRTAGLMDSSAALRICDLGPGTTDDVLAISRGHFLLSAEVQMDTLLDLVRCLPHETRWDALARATITEDLYRTVATLTMRALRSAGSAPTVAEQISAWQSRYSAELDRIRQAIVSLLEFADPGLGPVWLILRDLQRLAEEPAVIPSHAPELVR